MLPRGRLPSERRQDGKPAQDGRPARALGVEAPGDGGEPQQDPSDPSERDRADLYKAVGTAAAVCVLAGILGTYGRCTGWHATLYGQHAALYGSMGR